MAGLGMRPKLYPKRRVVRMSYQCTLHLSEEFSSASAMRACTPQVQKLCNLHNPISRGRMGGWGPTAQKIFIGRWVGAMVAYRFRQ